MKSSELSYKLVGFFDLVCDASFTYFHSRTSRESYDQRRFARASILTTALFIESFANCTIGSLKLSSKMFTELDRLPSLSKIDIYLKFSELEMLDRSTAEVQRVDELIKARNNFVHSKTSKIKSELAPAVIRSVDVPRWDFTAKPEFYDALGIAKAPFIWTSDDAHRALLVACGFLRYVMSRLDNNRLIEIRKSLLSTIEINGISMPYSVEPYLGELERLYDAGIDLLPIVGAGTLSEDRQRIGRK